MVIFSITKTLFSSPAKFDVYQVQLSGQVKNRQTDGGICPICTQKAREAFPEEPCNRKKYKWIESLLPERLAVWAWADSFCFITTDNANVVRPINHWPQMQGFGLYLWRLSQQQGPTPWKPINGNKLLFMLSVTLGIAYLHVCCKETKKLTKTKQKQLRWLFTHFKLC